jgi:hypothetical protein
LCIYRDPRAFAKTPQYKSAESADVRTATMRLVVIDSIAVGAARAIRKARELKVVRLFTAWHLGKAMARLSRLVSR